MFAEPTGKEQFSRSVLLLLIGVVVAILGVAR
jgi:hypothetical protein